MARDGKYQKLTEEPAPYFYLPTLQQRYASFMTLHVRATDPALNLLPAVRREVQTLDPTMPISNVRTLAEQLSDSLRDGAHGDDANSASSDCWLCCSHRSSIYGVMASLGGAAYARDRHPHGPGRASRRHAQACCWPEPDAHPLSASASAA
ncbi:MAG: hypothetical protein WKF84_09705 [Pyrinomonadaceae bacterium]